MKLLYVNLTNVRKLISIALMGIFLLAVSAVQGQTVTVTTDMDDYWPGSWVHITGTGWQAGETVQIVIKHMVFTSHPNDNILLVANDNGIIDNDFKYFIDYEELGESFLLTATGLSSGKVAATKFTDTPPTTPDYPKLVVTGLSSTGPFCPGSSFTIFYSATGTGVTFNSGNYFQAYLSNGGGNWPSSPDYLGQHLNSGFEPNGSITATIPKETGVGSGYNIRIYATSSAGWGTIYSFPLVIAGSPSAFNVTGGGSYCPGGTGISIGLNNSQTGVNYQLHLNGIATGTPVAGTGSAISFGNQLGFGTYTVIGVSTTSPYCTNEMNGDATISSSSDSAPGALTKHPDASSVCSGTDVWVTATAGTGGGTGAVDILEYRYDGAVTWSAYTSDQHLATPGHSLVEVRTYRHSLGGQCVDSEVRVVSWDVSLAVVITDQPDNATMTYGDTDPVFTIAATNATGYQWQVDTGGGFTDIAGANSASLTITAPAVAMSGSQFRCVVLGCNGETESTSALLTINKKDITGNFTAENKVYDGNTSAVVLTRTLDGVEPGDDVLLVGGTAGFSDENIGTGKTVNLVGASLSGSDADNYNLSSVNIATADITAVQLTPHITANDKPYDGNTTATLSAQWVTGQVSGEAVTLIVGTASFDTKNIGINKTVTASSLTLGGADAGNYLLGAGATATDVADITAIAVCGEYTGDLYVNTSVTDLTATVNLSIKVTPTPDNSATCTFKCNNSSICATCTQDGIFAASFTVSLNKANLFAIYDVSWEISGNYTNSSCPDVQSTIATVTVPTNDFITGGGYILPQYCDLSKSMICAAEGSKTNFGFAAKFTNKLTNLQGNFNAIIKAGNGKTYQVKTNKPSVLNIPKPYTDCSTVAAITYQNVVIKEIGCTICEPNLTSGKVELRIADCGEPATKEVPMDKIGFAIFTSTGRLWYSTNSYNQTSKLVTIQDLTRGNIQIHLSNTKSAEIVYPGDGKASLLVYPNPFNDRLRFEFTTPSDTYARISIYDVAGCLVRTVFDGEVKSSVDYQADFRPSDKVSGIFIYRMTIGDQVLTGKVIYRK